MEVHPCVSLPAVQADCDPTDYTDLHVMKPAMDHTIAANSRGEIQHIYMLEFVMPTSVMPALIIIQY